MKINVVIDENETKFFLDAEAPKDNVEIMKAVKRAKKPCRAFGAIRSVSGLAWAWMCFPNKKISNWDVLNFDNENKKS